MSYQELYQQLVKLHTNDAMRYFARWGASFSEVEDLVQEVFLEAWKSLPNYRTDASLKLWFLGICKHTAWSFARRRTKKLAQLSDQALEEQIGLDGRDWSESYTGMLTILKFVPQLAEEQQEVLHLYYMLQLSEREIAEHLNIPQGTIHSRLRAARQRLKAFCEADKS